MSVPGLHKKCGARVHTYYTRVRDNGSLTQPCAQLHRRVLLVREGGNEKRERGGVAESEELDIINLFVQKDRNYLMH